jgi:hypothetical protein
MGHGLGALHDPGLPRPEETHVRSLAALQSLELSTRYELRLKGSDVRKVELEIFNCQFSIGN